MKKFCFFISAQILFTLQMNNKKYYPFMEISEKYNEYQNQLDNQIKTMYSLFSFHFIDIKDNQYDDHDYESNLIDIIKQFKFTVLKTSNMNYSVKSLKCQDPFNNFFFFVICAEKHCFIIKNIEMSSITRIINQLYITKLNESFVILDSIPGIKATKDITVIKEEINSFINPFKRNLPKNEYIQNTIYPMTAYLIRRFYYPSHFFDDPSFFSYSNLDNEQIIDLSLFSTEQIQKRYEKEANIHNTENKIHYFYPHDFIKLRTVSSSNKSILYLVLHIKTFYLFVLKWYGTNSDNKDREISILENNLIHRSILKFYGFYLENKNAKTGILYEFMSNGSLDNYIKKQNENISHLFSYSSAFRIFDGIKYLNSKNIIHRDLRPKNILIDHNFLCYISDFDTAKILDQDQNTNMTFDIGSPYFSSPEQYLGLNTSFETDIYSFGQLVFFLFERTTMLKTTDIDVICECLDKNEINFTDNTPITIKNIILQCIKKDPKERLKINVLDDLLKQEVKIYDCIDEYFINMKQNYFKKDELFVFLYENLYMIFKNTEQSKFQSICDNYQYLMESIKEDNFSNFFYMLGLIYQTGDGTKKDYKKAHDYYQKSIEIDDKNSQSYLNLGILYFNGYGVNQDYLQALNYFEKSSDPNSYFYLGLMYFNEYGVTKNYRIAEDYFKKTANNGNSNGWLYLGQLYLNEKKIKESIESFESSAKMNNDYAQEILGDMYLKGENVTKDFQKAKEYYQKVKNQNNSDITFKLGYIYFKNEKNIKEGIKYYKRAAKQNNIRALNTLGDIYLDGDNVPQDFKKARKYIDLSAQLNDPNALCKRGYMAFQGKGEKRNVLKAIEYYNKAAEQGFYYGHFGLGYVYYKGNPKNIIKAEEELKKALELNPKDPESLNMLGYIYLNEYDEREKHANAKKLFEEAAKYDDRLAFGNLGDYYRKSKYESRDIRLAKLNYEKASKKGNSDSSLKLGKIYLKEKQYEEAEKYFKIAKEAKNPDSYYFFGKLFYFGNKNKMQAVVKQSFSKAIHYFTLASYLSHSNAKYYLGIINFKGLGIERNYKNAYFLFNDIIDTNLNALFYLGYMHENGFGVKRDISKAKFYYTKSIEKEKDNFTLSFNSGYKKIKVYNDFYYQSLISLALIDIIENDESYDLDITKKYIQKAGNSQHPFGVYVYGVFYQYYLNNKELAMHKFNQVPLKNFSLAYFNLANFCEKDSNEEINYYRQSLQYENNSLTYKNKEVVDDRIEISQLFINCYTYLKLIRHILANELYLNDQIKVNDYMIKIIFRLVFKLLCNTNGKYFEFLIKHQFNLKDFIFQFPLFGLETISQNNSKNEWKTINTLLNSNKITLKNIDDRNEDFYFPSHQKKKIESNNESDQNYCLFGENIIDRLEKICKDMNQQKNITFMSRNEGDNIIVKFIFENEKIQRILEFSKNVIENIFMHIYYHQKEILDLILEMDKVIYSKPYKILFCRMSPYIPKKQKEIPEINHLFYEGFMSNTDDTDRIINYD